MSHGRNGTPVDEEGVSNKEGNIGVIPSLNTPGDGVDLGGVAKRGSHDSGFEHHAKPAVVAEGASNHEGTGLVGHPGAVASSSNDRADYSVNTRARHGVSLKVGRPHWAGVYRLRGVILDRHGAPSRLVGSRVVENLDEMDGFVPSKEQDIAAVGIDVSEALGVGAVVFECL